MHFWKYQGAGNDFIMVDQRQNHGLTHNDQALIERLCNRRFGIGADGLILLENQEGYDFRMVYFNADGRESSMCGNGGRCIAAFAHQLGIIGKTGRFLAIDGEHHVHLTPQQPSGHYWVELHMNDVKNVESCDPEFVLNTGSPHFVRFVEDTSVLDMRLEGRAVRYSERFAKDGINVNLAEVTGPNTLRMRTYERGVEDETLACGTGVTAAALAYYLHENKQQDQIELQVEALGGSLSVRFKHDSNNGFYDVWLCGPAQCVFSGKINLHETESPTL
ncbi:MAG: diaminopimelate epimerase [Saprospiraceae bacterium]|nr:diaminopimelate epimerase [Saprospiraceae bacterium]